MKCKNCNEKILTLPIRINKRFLLLFKRKYGYVHHFCGNEGHIKNNKYKGE